MRLVAPLLFAYLLAGAVQAKDNEQWARPGKDFAATRFSGLDQITAANVGQLHSVWNFSTGVLSGHEGQPLVVNDTMYVVTPYPNVLYAFDLTKEDYPLRFKYRPDVNPASVGIACCDSVNRGAVYAEGKIVYNLLDGRTVAVDAQTGQEVWKVAVADLSQGETITMAPMVRTVGTGRLKPSVYLRPTAQATSMRPARRRAAQAAPLAMLSPCRA